MRMLEGVLTSVLGDLNSTHVFDVSSGVHSYRSSISTFCTRFSSVGFRFGVGFVFTYLYPKCPQGPLCIWEGIEGRVL
jgi:hypothetical protein